MNTQVLLSVLLITASSVMGQTSVITSLSHAGKITWFTDGSTGLLYDIEWAPQLDGNWERSWNALSGQIVTGQQMSASVPMFYRVSQYRAGLDCAIARYTFAGTDGANVLDTIAPPMNLVIADPGNVVWLSGGGLSITSPTIIAATNSAKLFHACTNSGEFSVEAWIEPARSDLSGPARIVTYSQTQSARNFTVGVSGASLVLRCRSNYLTNGGNGLPELAVPEVLGTNLIHVVYTRGRDGYERSFVDGVQKSLLHRPGDLGNWDPSFVFALGREINSVGANRAYLGAYRRVTLYSQALTAAEVLHLHGAGP